MFLINSYRYATSGGGGGDPSFSSVKALLHFEGTNLSTTITDVTGRSWNVSGTASISTAQSRYGTASLILDGTGDYVVPASTSADFTPGTGDFCIEVSIRATSLAKAVSGIVDTRPVSTQGLYPFIYVNSSGSIRYYTNSADRITSGNGVITTNTWYDIAYARVGGTGRLFVNGTQVGSSYADSNNYVCNSVVVGHLGFDRSNLFGITGHVDEFRWTTGAGRYSGNYTPAAFPDS